MMRRSEFEFHSLRLRLDLAAAIVGCLIFGGAMVLSLYSIMKDSFGVPRARPEVIAVEIVTWIIFLLLTLFTAWGAWRMRAFCYGYLVQDDMLIIRRTFLRRLWHVPFDHVTGVRSFRIIHGSKDKRASVGHLLVLEDGSELPLSEALSVWPFIADRLQVRIQQG